MSATSEINYKKAVRGRIHELVVEDKQRKSLINAYMLKKHVLEDDMVANDHPESYTIRTSDPLIVPPEGKYSHTPGALISSKAYSPPKTNSPGVSPSRSRICAPSTSPLVKKLTSKAAFPTTYINRIESTLHENENGDIVDMSKRTSKLLKDASASSLYMPNRASDFRSEIRWRLMLRNSS